MTFANSLYLSWLGFGLFGGFAHCIGMCGVFVLASAGLPDKNDSRRLVHPIRHLLFHAGRLATLTLLGLFGGEIGALDHRWATLQSAVSITAGLMMLGLALGLAGVLPQFRLPEPDLMNAGGGRLRKLFLRALKSRSVLRPLLIGLFVGLLPCGLTYLALIGTFTLRPLSGGLLMFLFGLGTVPGLLTLGLVGNTLSSGLLTSLRFRSRMTRAAAVLMGLLAVAFVWRGVTNF